MISTLSVPSCQSGAASRKRKSPSSSLVCQEVVDGRKSLGASNVIRMAALSRMVTRSALPQAAVMAATVLAVLTRCASTLGSEAASIWRAQSFGGSGASMETRWMSHHWRRLL